MMDRQVSYFCMEIGVDPDIKTYSGGLGALAGDTVKAAADHDLNFNAVTLLYRNGFFRQVIEKGDQDEKPQEWDHQELLEDTGVMTSVWLRDRKVDIKVWKYTVKGVKGEVDIYFLDTAVDSNTAEDRKLTSRLYMGGREKRLCQEAILGIGGNRALEELGIESTHFHMNEGHSGLLTTEAEGNMVFTTHTPVPAGHDTFTESTVEKVLPEEVREKIDYSEGLNMTKVALKHANYCNGVSDRHAEVSNKMFSQYEIDAITNGVHSRSWTSKPFADLYDDNIPKWRFDPARLARASGIEDHSIWRAKKRSKNELARHLSDRECGKLDEDVFTVGFARRSTSYKRPTLIFQDIEELERLATKHEGLQLVFGGKAHPDDRKGKDLISKIFQFSEMLENVDVYFVENYGLENALKMVSGVDLWLNNPERGKEACGTSGMKAAHNGTPQLSTPDGWWLEGCIEGITGWMIGESYVEGEDENRIDSQSIYRKLDEIMSLYYKDRKQWIEIMKHCITLNAAHFNTDRMLKEYITRAYK